MLPLSFPGFGTREEDSNATHGGALDYYRLGGADSAQPLLVGFVPLYRFVDSGFECIFGRPAEFGLYFGRIDRITAIMTQAILNVLIKTLACWF